MRTIAWSAEENARSQDLGKDMNPYLVHVTLLVERVLRIEDENESLRDKVKCLGDEIKERKSLMLHILNEALAKAQEGMK